MSENKKVLTEKKNEDVTSIYNKNILFKEHSSISELKDAFLNINTDCSLESEKEKTNLSLYTVLRKKLKEEEYYSRFLIMFKMLEKKKKYIDTTLKNIMTEKYQIIKGICIFINIYSIMFLESKNTKDVISFLQYISTIDNILDVQILYFTELNIQNINNDFYFYEYNKEGPVIQQTLKCNYVDQVWELYINMLNLSCFIKNNKNKNKQNVLSQNEDIKINLFSIMNLYSDEAKEYLWNMEDFTTFFVDEFKLPIDDFSEDFLDF
ncbi:conserved protein, unknown function [Hepatocystis sp. ex Piliocolobus tephrosceles]|nr:conserved protein, unknown function [Hepatocystis sp. ex Piliocolobus tephrosceles]